MNKLIIYKDEKTIIDNESKTRVVVFVDDNKQELYLNNESIEKLIKSDKFLVEQKTFADKILDEFDRTKPSFCDE